LEKTGGILQSGLLDGESGEFFARKKREEESGGQFIAIDELQEWLLFGAL